MRSRVVVVVIIRRVQARKVEEQERAKVNDKARTETDVVECWDSRRTRRGVKLERGLTSRCLHQCDRV